MFERVEAEKRAAERGVLGGNGGLVGGRATSYTGPEEAAQDCVPRYQSVTGSPVQAEGRITAAVRALEDQIAYAEKALAAIEHRTEVFRRPVPTGANGVEKQPSAGSVFANGLLEMAARLAVVNARLHELASSIDV